MSENKIKLAQDLMSPYSGGKARGGFNSRVFGILRHELSHHESIEYKSGWDLADGMIEQGKIYYVQRFPHSTWHGTCRGTAFPYGGTWVCNDCGNQNLDKPWWKIKVYKDGNAWCCVGEGFENLQESENYAFGDTRDEAIENYGLIYRAAIQSQEKGAA